MNEEYLKKLIISDYKLDNQINDLEWETLPDKDETAKIIHDCVLKEMKNQSKWLGELITDYIRLHK